VPSAMTQKPDTPVEEGAYRLGGIEQLLTPLLVVYLEKVDANIAATIRAMNGNPSRLRPHLKTAKLEKSIGRFVAAGVDRCKCATTLEFEVACAAGMRDVLIAFPMMGVNARRIEQLSKRHRDVALSVLVDHPEQIRQWRAPVGMFIDVNPGMDRTGIGVEQVDEAMALIKAIGGSGHTFRGLHYYEGHLGSIEFEERRSLATQGYDKLTQLVAAIERRGVAVSEVNTSGSFVFMFAREFVALAEREFAHRVSPGAAIYGDLNTMLQIPASYGIRPAALVATRVVSHPRADLVTCDAGLKAVAGFAGLPNCAVVGWPSLAPQRMSEEHLTLQAPAGTPLPPLGSILYLIPRHAGLTVNNFDEAVVVDADGKMSLERVSARGHESPIAGGGLPLCASTR
jgi:D-serine deaminase-like pyridoxal phosphate-dependent protein